MRSLSPLSPIYQTQPTLSSASLQAPRLSTTNNEQVLRLLDSEIEDKRGAEIVICLSDALPNCGIAILRFKAELIAVGGKIVTRLLVLVAILSTVACASPNGDAPSQTADAALNVRPARIDPSTKVCVTLRVHRDAYQPDYPNEWMNFDAAFAVKLGELNRAGDFYALSTQSEQLLFAGDASSCSRFPGFVAIAARYYREPGARLPVFEYTMQGVGSVQLERVSRRYVDEDIADPALFRDIGNPLGWALGRVLERRAIAILDELSGRGE